MMESNDEYPENDTFSSPFKAVVDDDADIDPRADQQDGEDEQSVQEAPSSPFQFDGRDDTVDFQELQAMQAQDRARASPLVPSEHSATPRKRSYEHVPDDQDEGDNEDSEGRYRKGANRRDEPEINVYTDEGATNDAGGEGGSNSMVEEKHNEGMSTVLHGDNEKENDADDDAMDNDDLHDDMDETGLSTFSAVPNADMTSFAKLRESPTKALRDGPSNNPAASEQPGTPSSAKMPSQKSTLIDFGTPAGSPTPRRKEYMDYGNVSPMPNLLDFDEKPALSPRPRYSMQNVRYSPTRPSPLKVARESIRTPSKASLLDFDIPPAPTPRSIPTVTPRELESLKSSFMSEISSLKATLSGREAEVTSLKQAVADAERRVGEAMEEVRNEAARKESLELEQAEWERRGEEMEAVLCDVKADIVEGKREKAGLMKKVEETEKSKEHLEGRMVELESQLSAARKTAESASQNTGSSNTTTQQANNTAEDTAREVQEAVEKVARELHTLYKGKHETKVAALKKSYETRWEKRVREAENKVKGVQEENDRMKEEREKATASETAKSRDEVTSMMAHAKDEHEAEKWVLEAQIKGLQQEMVALREDRERLQMDLESERTEKGELVAAVDEWLAIQQQAPQAPETTQQPASASPEPTRKPSVEPAMEDFRRSVSSGSGSGSGSASVHRAPLEKERKIPKVGGASGARGTRGPGAGAGGKSGIAVFTPGRSGIMGSIERMGRGQ